MSDDPNVVGHHVAITYFDPPIQCDKDTEINITYEVKQMPNTRNRKHLRAQMDLLADGHQVIMDRAAHINNRLLHADGEPKQHSNESQIRWISRNFERLKEALHAQEARLTRTRAELYEIKKNLRHSS